MQENLGVLIAAARRRMKQAVLARISARHLSPQQFWLVVALSEHPGVSQTCLADRTRADAPTISRAITTLAERKLVRMELDPADRRRTQIFLTVAGERLARELAPIAREIRDTMVGGMSHSELVTLREGLRRIIANLDQLDARDENRGTKRVRA